MLPQAVAGGGAVLVLAPLLVGHVQALAVLTSEKVDCCFTDINMPEMDGVNCAEKIFDLNPNAKIAFITGYEVEGLDEFGDRIKASVKTFLTKPVELADLSSALSQMLQS